MNGDNGSLQLCRQFSPSFHNVTCMHVVQAVKDSEPLRTAVDEVQPERVKLSLRLSQSKPLYEAFKGIKEGKLWGQLSEAQQRIVDGELRDFVLGGVALEVRKIQSCGVIMGGSESQKRACISLQP